MKKNVKVRIYGHAYRLNSVQGEERELFYLRGFKAKIIDDQLEDEIVVKAIESSLCITKGDEFLVHPNQCRKLKEAK